MKWFCFLLSLILFLNFLWWSVFLLMVLFFGLIIIVFSFFLWFLYFDFFWVVFFVVIFLSLMMFLGKYFWNFLVFWLRIGWVMVMVGMIWYEVVVIGENLVWFDFIFLCMCIWILIFCLGWSLVISIFGFIGWMMFLFEK